MDDPYSFGMVAAANSLSDVYAMGGRPLTAMNIVGFPSEALDIGVLQKILEGALRKLDEAGVAMVGGHSVKDEEIKFGLAVTGVVHPRKVITSAGARVGDKLILTKPLGTGIQSTALKAGLLDDEAAARLTRQMAALNRKASEVMLSSGVNACTDISGFGFIGHACQMAEASGVAIELNSLKVPFIDGVDRLASQGLIPAGMYANKDFRLEMVEVEGDVVDWLMDILFDPQTSGGLLIAAPAKTAGAMLTELKKAGIKEAALVGTVVERPRPETRIILR